MKKVIAILTICLAAMSVSFAEEEKEKTSSEFEKVLLQKGTMISKEFKSFDSLKVVSGMNGSISTEIATLTDVPTGAKVYALRISHYYYNSKFDSGEAVGVLDAKELASVVSSFKYIKKYFAEETDKSKYVETAYTSNSGMSLGAYHSKGGKEYKVFIKINYKDTIYVDYDKLDEIIEFFEKAEKELNSK